MQTHREKVRDFLRLWVNTKNSPHFAVLIEGEWGCGKTFFIKNLIKEKNFTKRNCLYLSLFGLKDIEAFRASLFEVSASQLSKFFNGAVYFLFIVLMIAVGAISQKFSKMFCEHFKHGAQG